MLSFLHLTLHSSSSLLQGLYHFETSSSLFVNKPPLSCSWPTFSHILKENGLPFPSSHQLYTAPRCGGFCLLHIVMLMGLICAGLVQLRVLMCSGPVMSRKHCFSLVLSHLCLTQSFHSSFTMVPEVITGKECVIDVPFLDKHFKDVFCALTSCEFWH